VPLPPNVVFIARASNPAASLKLVTDWAKLPPLDASTVVLGIVTELLHSKGAAPLAAIVDTSQPMDAVGGFEVKLPPRGLGAFAMAVKDVEAAKTALAAAYDLRPEAGGVLRLLPRAGLATEPTKDDNADGGAVCELAPAAGAAPFRLVCGTNDASLAQLAPYLTRTLPRTPAPADVHVEVKTGPIAGLATLGRMEGPKAVAGLLGLHPTTEPARVDLVAAFIGDLFDYVGDLDTMTSDLTFSPAGAEGVFKTSFQSTSSLLAHLSVSHPETSDVPPSTFWRVPPDVDFASFGSGVDDEDLRRPRELLAAAVDEALETQKLSAGSRKALVDLAGALVRGSGGVLAHGEARGVPYWLLEWNVASQASQKLVRDIAAIRARPDVVKWLAADARAAASLPTVKILGALQGLPANTLHVRVTVLPSPGTAPPTAPSKGPPPKGPHAAASMVATGAPKEIQLALVPDGPRTWIAVAPTDAALRAALSSPFASTGAKTAPGSLASSAALRGLDAWKATRMTSGGFCTVRGLVEIGESAASKDAPGSPWEEVLSRLPAHGESAITWESSPLPPTPSLRGGAREVRLQVPADAVRDAVLFGLQSDALSSH
jgi:hypothetical protein